MGATTKNPSGTLPKEVPLAGEFYRHFKGNLYQVIGVAYDAGTMEPMVVYWALDGEGRWYVRALEEFFRPVDKEKYPDSTAQYCFERVNLEGVLCKEVQSGDKESLLGEEVKSGKTQECGAQDPLSGSGSVEMREIRKDTLGAEQAFQPAKKEAAPDWSNPEAQKVRPELLRFLDAETPGEKLAVLREIRGKLDEDLMTNIELSIDLMSDGREPLEQRLTLVEKTLEKRVRYEGTRLR